MDETPPAPITDQEAHERLISIADDLGAEADRCETVAARTAMRAAAETIYTITAGLLLTAIRKK